MTKNMGKTDRIVRIVVAIVLALLILFQALTGAWAVVLGIVAAILLLTSIVSFCPLYVPFKFSTNKDEKTEKKKE